MVEIKPVRVSSVSRMHGSNDLKSRIRAHDNVSICETDDRALVLVFATCIKQIANVRNSFAVLTPKPPEFLVADRPVGPRLFCPGGLRQQMTALCVNVVRLVRGPDVNYHKCKTSSFLALRQFHSTCAACRHT